MRRAAFFALLALAAALFTTSALAEVGDGFRLAAESDGLALYVNETTLETRVENKRDGRAYYTKIMDGASGNKTTKNNEKSDIRAYYVVNESVGTTNSMDSYSMSVEYGNFEIAYIENGFEIAYEIGDMTLTVDDLPKMIPVDKYNELLLPYWSTKQDDLFREFYRIYQQTMWVRTDDGSIGKVKLTSLHSQLYEIGSYTREDLEEDNAAYGYEIENVNPRVDVKIRFQLDGDDLLVSVPCGEIAFTEGNPVTRLDILPYFLTATTEDEGYIFVPDGSGSLISLNNGKTMALSYTDRVYGSDPLMNVNRYSPESESINLPVYGIKTEGAAALAIIEKGAELASIYADISGRSDEFNRVYATFALRDIEFISVIGNMSDTTPRCPEDVYTGDIAIRYRFLSGDQADCVGMAKAYREYLLSRGMLVEREADERAPMFVELIGAVRKTKFFAGIPYHSTAQATTLAQAGVIADALSEAGVSNLLLRFTGMFAGGVRHESLNGVTLEGAVGSAAELAALSERVKAAGGTLFPSVNLVKVYTSRDFDENAQAARRQDNFISSIPAFGEPILAREHEETESFYVSPRYIARYAEKAASGLAALGVGNLCVGDLAGLLMPDYRKGENVSRVHATNVNVGVLAELAENFALMLDDPNDYALSYATYVTGLSSSDNGHKVEDEAVPFTQWVLEGCCEYAAQPWNREGYIGTREAFLYAIESKTAPYFQLTWADETVFLQTDGMASMDYFMTQYERWLDHIGEVYAEYDAFWQKVKGASTVDHDILPGGARRVKYDNGVTVYVNYSSSTAIADGHVIPALGYLVLEGGASR